MWPMSHGLLRGEIDKYISCCNATCLLKVLWREGFILPGSEKRRIKNGSRQEKTFVVGFWVWVGVHQMGQIQEKRMSKMGRGQSFKGTEQSSLLYSPSHMESKDQGLCWFSCLFSHQFDYFLRPVFDLGWYYEDPRVDLAFLSSYYIVTPNPSHQHPSWAALAAAWEFFPKSAREASVGREYSLSFWTILSVKSKKMWTSWNNKIATLY